MPSSKARIPTRRGNAPVSTAGVARLCSSRPAPLLFGVLVASGYRTFNTSRLAQFEHPDFITALLDRFRRERTAPSADEDAVCSHHITHPNGSFRGGNCGTATQRP
jgi:hypothetical protein